jgi:hypothetical protein
MDSKQKAQALRWTDVKTPERPLDDEKTPRKAHRWTLM